MLSLLLLLLLTPITEAKEQKTVKGTQTSGKENVNSAKVLWKEWYLLTIQGEAQGYFVEEFEKRVNEKQLAISQTWFEKREGGVSTFIGSVASDNSALSPVAFFSDRKSAMKAYKVDGRVKGGTLELKLKPEGSEGGVEKTYPMGKDFLLSNFLPYALTHQLKPGSPLSFSAIVEDPMDTSFELHKGNASRQSGNKQIKTEECKKFEVTIDGKGQSWWVADSGKLCEVYLPFSDSKLELSSEENIKKLFP